MLDCDKVQDERGCLLNEVQSSTRGWAGEKRTRQFLQVKKLSDTSALSVMKSRIQKTENTAAGGWPAPEELLTTTPTHMALRMCSYILVC